MKKLLIIKAGTTYASIRNTLGDFEDWILGRMEIPRSSVLVHPAYEKSEMPGLEGVSAVIVTGSHAMVTCGAGWIGRLSAWLRQTAATGIPLLGICFGHQLVARAFGGTVGFHPGGKELGNTLVTLTGEGREDPLFRSFPTSFPAYAAHSQTVVTLPPDAHLLAKNAFEPHHAFSIGRNIRGVQFHPEFNAEIMRGYILHARKQLEKDGHDVEEMLGAVTENPYGKILLKRFAEIAS
jgi:GMP synthase (glutamine-hydrolysing)